MTHASYLPGVREQIRAEMDEAARTLEKNAAQIAGYIETKRALKKNIDELGAWRDYDRLERDFWKFIKERDLDLWFVLDPVITVHPDQVSFEAFSADESIYGCLSIAMDEFELLAEPKLGTTNIDFSAKLALEMERFRTYSRVELSVNPEGFAADSGAMPERVEKKIDLPESWIKGFNQVSSAASLGGIELELPPADLYDLCLFFRRHKAAVSPRYMKWVLEPNRPIKVVLEPFGTTLTLKANYTGPKKREEKIWGSRRWLVLEKIVPLAKSFTVRLLGFGMPQFVVADMGNIKLTVGFSSWSANDWVSGTAFNILGGFVGDGNYDEVYALLKDKRAASIQEIFDALPDAPQKVCKAGIGMLLKRGEGYYDPIRDAVRFRRLLAEPIPKRLYETTDVELQVAEHLGEGMDRFAAMLTGDGTFVFRQEFRMPNAKYRHWRHQDEPEYNQEFVFSKTELAIDNDGRIDRVKCNCRAFQKGARNISEPCAHLLALYIMSIKFLKLNIETDKVYEINDIMEMLL